MRMTMDSPANSVIVDVVGGMVLKGAARATTTRR